MLKSKNLEDKVIIVVGGSGLIGKAILIEAQKQFTTVINIDLIKSGVNGIYEIFTDVTKPECIKDTLVQIKDKYRIIDGLINSSYPKTKGWGKSNIENTSFEEIDLNVTMHLNSYYYISQQVLIIMKEQGYGSLLNFASIYGSVGNDFELYKGLDINPPVAYSFIKGGIINLTRYLASYFGKYNLRVNCLSPGGIFDNQNPEFVRRYEERVPMKRMCTPNDVAPVACFLMTDGAKYITGQNIIVDGGWTCI